MNPSDLTDKIAKEVEEEAMLETFLENKETLDTTIPQDNSCNIETCNIEKDPMSLADTQETTPAVSPVDGENVDQALELPKESKKSHSQKPLSKEVEAFQLELEKESDPDTKLKKAIEKMESYLSMGGSPQFKNFWEVRKLCLELFKLNISQNVRGILWPKYSELSKEARRLKEILDEQSAFAVEQIDMAISAIENEMTSLEQGHEVGGASAFEFQCKSLEASLPIYSQIQNRLNVLNAHAVRVNNLRKELIKVDMRIKFKNKFFQRLSSIGDKVFPQRKELIKEISDRFINDVESFIKAHFDSRDVNENVFFLREEIKALQGIAKTLTLNTQSFTQTRKRLSECWDTLKVVDKERRKERAEKREIFQQNKVEIEEKIQEVKSAMEQGTLPFVKAAKSLDDIQVLMRSKELGRDEVKYLRDLIGEIRTTIKEHHKSEEDARLKFESEKLAKKKSFIADLQQKIDALVTGALNMKADLIEEQRDLIINEISALKDLSSREKNDLERPLRNLRDVISIKREEEVLSLSDDDQNALHNLREILRQRQKRRKEIKEQLDGLRKTAGNSGFNIEQAMHFNEQVNLEKERLDKADEGIREIEDKIRHFKKK